ncbi:hypothetical protein BKA66DRAFT_582566 [Pyrenochaeta sp. MPI-SDFR-AT-0127]|nr:hypothetical protein BKA66DRAFT_582566 [Pyrenochaeta sp. MPI-SDFR-AT-0127]
METISNIASTATSTVSNLIYGDQTKKNETDGKEPVSGQEGKGTATEPFDQGNAATPLDTADKKAFLDESSNDKVAKDSVAGEKADNASDTASGSNDFLKLNPTLDGPATEEGAPKIHTNASDPTYTGMPIVPLDPDVATSGVEKKSSSTTEATGITDQAGVTNKVWKETPLDDISRAGAPGAGPDAPDSTTPSKAPVTDGTDVAKDSKVEQSLDGSVSPKNTTSLGVGATESGATGESKGTWIQKAGHTLSKADGVAGLVGEKSTHKSDSSKPVEPVSSATSEEKSSKISHLKGKLKDKLHIGSKDK